MDESGIIGQMILECNGKIKKSSGTLDNPKLIPFLTTIVSSTAKILDKQSLNRITLSYQETDIDIFLNFLVIDLINLQYQSRIEIVQQIKYLHNCIIIYIDQSDIVVLERKK